MSPPKLKTPNRPGRFHYNILDEELLLEPSVWEVSDLASSVCTCDIPSTENLIQCRGPSCPIAWFHRQCVGLGEGLTQLGLGVASSSTDAPAESHGDQAVGEEWTCEICVNSAHTTSTRDSHDLIPSKESENTQGAKHQGDEQTHTPKRKKAKFTPQITKEAADERARDMFSTILEKISNHCFYEGHVAVKLAQNILTKLKLTTSLSDDISKIILTLIWDCVIAGDSHSLGTRMNCSILAKFHEMRCGTEVLRHWEAFLDGAGIGGDRLARRCLLQCILRRVLQDVVNLRNGFPEDGEKEENAATLTKECEGVLRLVAGYVPFALIKKYSKMKSTLGNRFKEFLLTWRVTEDDSTEADSFLSYTSVWMTHQNRGGLFEVSDQVYKFFRSMEFVVIKQLNIHKLVSSSFSAKGILEREIRSNRFVEQSWAILICKHLTRGESDALFTTVINYYIKIRLKNFVRLYVNLKKREQAKNVSKKGTKGLRKQLKKASKK
nr:uncharacterized protein LOC129268494 [Lytechinus pictus]